MKNRSRAGLALLASYASARLMRVRSVVQLYPGPYIEKQIPQRVYTLAGFFVGTVDLSAVSGVVDKPPLLIVLLESVCSVSRLSLRNRQRSEYVGTSLFNASRGVH